jgi:DNA-binding CsgD family transcriptional regulator
MINLFKNLTSPFSLEKIDTLNVESFKNLPFHLYWKDKQGKYLGCNDVQAEATGFKIGSDLCGLTDFDFLCDTEAASVKNNDDYVFVNKKSNFFLESPTFEGSRKVIAISCKHPLRMSSKKIIGTIGLSLIIEQSQASFLTGLNKNQKEFENIAKLFALTNGESLATNQQLKKSHANSINQYGLSKRQIQCLHYLMENNSIKEIARKLELSPRTVEHYLESVKCKLNCRTRIELIKKASQLII